MTSAQELLKFGSCGDLAPWGSGRWGHFWALRGRSRQRVGEVVQHIGRDRLPVSLENKAGQRACGLQRLPVSCGPDAFCGWVE